jgi:hypothetical protein
MQIRAIAGGQEADLVGLGVHVLLLSGSPAGAAGPTAQRISAMGGRLQIEAEYYAALAALHDDPADYGLFVMDCDDFGGLEVGRRAVALLGRLERPMPCILLGRAAAEQEFPTATTAPVILRAPVSAVSMRVGLEHALRGRLMWRRGQHELL